MTKEFFFLGLTGKNIEKREINGYRIIVYVGGIERYHSEMLLPCAYR